MGMGIEKSGGLVIVQNNQILLVHPTNAAWSGTYSIPKGKIEDFETPLDAAIRETKEEIGIDINPEWIENKVPEIIPYKNGKGKTYKKVFWYLVDLDKVGVELVISNDHVGKREVDWAGCLTLEEAKEKIFWRFQPILKLLEFYFEIREKNGASM